MFIYIYIYIYIFRFNKQTETMIQKEIHNFDHYSAKLAFQMGCLFNVLYTNVLFGLAQRQKLSGKEGN